MIWVPPHLGGLDLTNFELEQGLSQHKNFIKHGSVGTMTGKMICLSLEQLQLEVRTFKPIFKMSGTKYLPWVTDCWLKSLWEFCTIYEVQLRWEDVVRLSPCREDD